MPNSRTNPVPSAFGQSLAPSEFKHAGFGPMKIMPEIPTPFDRTESGPATHPVRPNKLLLIAMVIGLGAAVASFVQTGRFSSSEFRMSLPYAHSAIAASVHWTIDPRGTPNRTARRPFVERTPFPYLSASGSPHGARDLAFEN